MQHQLRRISQLCHGLHRDEPPTHTILNCQEVAEYDKPIIRPSLPEDLLLSLENADIDILDMEITRMKASKS